MNENSLEQSDNSLYEKRCKIAETIIRFILETNVRAYTMYKKLFEGTITIEIMEDRMISLESIILTFRGEGFFRNIKDPQILENLRFLKL